MDSEDERLLDVQEKKKKQPFWYPSVPTVCLRLYEDEEAQAALEIWRSEFGNHLQNGGMEPSSQSKPTDITGLIRARRFFHSLEGYHTGSLDLTGRSEARYRFLISRMKKLLEDLAKVKAYSKRIESVEHFGEHTFVFVDYEVTPPSVLQNFQAKWKMPYCDLGEIISMAVHLERVMEKHPKPIFQQLFLLDLPPELIHHVMACHDVQTARLLGATCRHLHEISVSHIYQSRRMGLWYDYALYGQIASYTEEETNKYFRDYSLEMHRKFLNDVDFLLSRRDILHRIIDLSFITGWRDDSLSRAGIERGSDAWRTYMTPVWDGFASALQHTIHLSTLKLLFTVVTPAMVDALAAIPTLRTLECHACPCALALQANSQPSLTSVCNVIIDVVEVDTHAALSILKHLPNVRVLGVHGGQAQVLDFDSLVHHGYILNPFLTSERMIVENASVETVFSIILHASAIASMPGGGLRLTHFKLESPFGLRSNNVFDMIGALRGAPLRVLALEGLEYVEDELFDRIATTFPDLRMLTLFRRESERQLRNRASAWPGTTGNMHNALLSFLTSSILGGTSA
ncbi:hypothetical protein BKA93DRAFT_397928 [Sparassis latifolia]